MKKTTLLICLLLSVFAQAQKPRSGSVSNEKSLDTSITEDRVPIFPGCSPEFSLEKQKVCFNKRIMEYVAKKFRFPSGVSKKVMGRVYVHFIINAQGDIEKVEAVRGIHPQVDAECERIIKSIPRMLPAVKNGKPVEMNFTIPINVDFS